jgi:hypothetical protein
MRLTTNALDHLADSGAELSAQDAGKVASCLWSEDRDLAQAAASCLVHCAPDGVRRIELELLGSPPHTRLIRGMLRVLGRVH